MKNSVDKIQQSRIKQVLSLLFSAGLSIIVGIGISIVNTRFLGPEHFGDYKFLQSLFYFLVNFFTLGFFITCGRAIAQEKNEPFRKDIIGAIVIIAILISAIFMISLLGFSYFQNRIFNNELGIYIRILIPLLFIYPFHLCMTEIFQGDNRIYALSAFRLFPSILYLIISLMLNFFFSFNLLYALLLQLTTISLAIITAIIFVKPHFKNIKKNITYLWEENKSYGFQVYIGTIFGTATAQLGELTIAYFIDNVNVGYYSLALTITSPLILIPGIVGTVFFKDFVNTVSIPTHVIVSTLSLSVIALICYLCVIKQVVTFLYSEQYMGVIPLSFIIAIGSVLKGLGLFYSKFLGAHGLGRYLRNATVFVGVVNTLGFFVLVHLFGALGASYTQIIAGAAYLFMMIYYYKRYREFTQLKQKE